MKASLIEYLCVHCTSTPPEMPVTKTDLMMWHMGPRDLETQVVRYRGVNYGSRESLRRLFPNENIGDIHISAIHGRGWDRLGYSDIIHRNGDVENLTPYDNDDLIEKHEMTWGAAGINSVSRHVVLEGGWKGKMKEGLWSFPEIFTPEQFRALEGYINDVVERYDWIKIIGHNQASKKTCPNFRVNPFLDMISVHEKNRK